MSEKLKPCPFCGCEAEIVTIDHFKPTGKLMYSVSCSTINCMGFMTGNDFIKKEYAVTAWNTRHQTTEVSELQKEVERLTILKDGQKEFVEHWGRVIIAFEKQFPREFHLAKRYAEDDFKKIEQALTTNGTKHE